MADDTAIGTVPRPSCLVCGEQGRVLYPDLKDRLFGAPGTWTLKECRNRDCGLVWLDPMPVAEDIHKAYRCYYTHEDQESLTAPWLRSLRDVLKRGYLAHRYGYGWEATPLRLRLASLLIYLHPGRRQGFDLDVMQLPAIPGGRLIEVGCGNGALLRSMKELGWQVEGVEVDEAAVKNARAKGLTVRLGSLEDQGYPDNSQDAVLMNHVIEHVVDPVALCRECLRVLKPGGHLSMTTPNTASWGHRLYAANWIGLDAPRHLHIFTVASLTAVARQAGFQSHLCRTAARTSYFFFASRAPTASLAAGQRVSASFSVRLRAETMMFLESLMLAVDGEAGEEIALVATK